MSEYLLIALAIGFGYLAFTVTDKFCNYIQINETLEEETGFNEGSCFGLFYYTVFQGFGLGITLVVYIILLGAWPDPTKALIPLTIAAWGILFALKISKELLKRFWHYICVGQGKAKDYYENYKIKAAKKKLLREQAAKEQLTGKSAAIPARGILEEIN